MTNEQTQVWLTLHIAYNIIHRNEQQYIEKLENKNKKDLQKKYEDLYKGCLESKKNNKEFESGILYLQCKKMEVEYERIALYDKVKFLEDRE